MFLLTKKISKFHYWSYANFEKRKNFFPLNILITHNPLLNLKQLVSQKYVLNVIIEYMTIINFLKTLDSDSFSYPRSNRQFKSTEEKSYPERY